MNVTENVTEPGGEQDRPRDDEIQAFHNRIRAADADKLELVGDKVRLAHLFSFLKQCTHVFFLEAVTDMCFLTISLSFLR